MNKKIALIIIALIGISSAVYFTYNKYAETNTNSLKKEIVKKIPEIHKLYGINTKNYKVETGYIQPNEYLSTIFQKYHISSKLHTILEKAKDIFDVRKIKSGQKYAVFFPNKDTSKTPDYFIYEKDKTDYLVFNLKDSMNVCERTKNVDVKIKEAAGVITSNLWFAMEDAGVNPILANDLSEIFAWTVDFFGLQRNDKFKMIYEEKFVNDTSIGYGKILAAYFEHYGDTIYAIPFKQDSIESFYDLDGNSLRKAFLKAPLKFSRISSGFSYARKHPILKIVRPHLGVDYAAPSGTPVHALGDGVVLKAYYTHGGGNFIKIKHNSVYSTGYMHLRGFAKGIHAGVRVQQGQVIGYVGMTGLATGPHLDFRVWKNGKNINPLHVDAPPVEPIKPEFKEGFNKTKKVYKDWLDKIKFKIVKPDTTIQDTFLIGKNPPHNDE
ncbi:MAG: peptidoglycan DD-metalloendopeptidase family protein [Bacteroidales bacterium]|nr:peptidoglycan DD-metalloendopeptidase family protein [Bacteroidales bacterium]